MLNRTVLVGRLTKNPELRYTPNGHAVANFTLAVNRPFSNNEGNREADFINVVVWRKAAENVANYLRKGSLAGVDGRLQTRSYENNDGKKIFVVEVVADSVQFLDTKNSQNGTNEQRNDRSSTNTFGSDQNANTGQNNGFNDDPFSSDGKPIDISADDLPF